MGIRNKGVTYIVEEANLDLQKPGRVTAGHLEGILSGREG